MSRPHTTFPGNQTFLLKFQEPGIATAHLSGPSPASSSLVLLISVKMKILHVGELAQYSVNPLHLLAHKKHVQGGVLHSRGRGGGIFQRTSSSVWRAQRATNYFQTFLLPRANHLWGPSLRASQVDFQSSHTIIPQSLFIIEAFW